MRIGLTYDLKAVYLACGYDEDEVAEFDDAETIRAIVQALAALGHDPVPIGHVRDLTGQLARGERWDLVFNIAEGLHGAGREAQVPALLEAFGIPYTFSDPLTLALALDKGMAKRVIRDAGIPTPDFAVIERMADVDQLRIPFPLFVKPVAEGSSKGVSGTSKTDDAAALVMACQALLTRYRQPVLVEQFLPGREFTVGVTGAGHDARALGIMEIRLHGPAEPGMYSRSNKKLFEDRVSYTLVEDSIRTEAIDVALAVWRTLNCRDAGRVDLRCDAPGAVHFLEVNPLAGLHPTTSDLVILCRLHGIGYQDLIGMIVSAAQERIKADRRDVASA